MRYTKAEVRQHRLAWVEALESGKYRQAQEELMKKIGGRYYYCCLGIACDLSGLGVWDYEKGRYVYTTDQSSEALLLPRDVADWLGIRGDDPWLGDHKASQLNDQLGWDFAEIARRARKVWGL